jgi:glycosyltransferase involved in cell wall biosynthesis
MRILLVNKYWRPFGGVETHVAAVTRVFEDLGHEVVPFGMRDPRNIETPYSRYFVPPAEMREGSLAARAHGVARAVGGLAAVRQIRRLLDEVQIDAAHVVHAYHHLGTTFLPVLQRRGIPVVLSLHDYKIGCPNYRLYSERTGRICTVCIDRPHAWAWAPASRKCWSSSALAGLALSAEAVVSRAYGTYRRAAGAVVVLNRIQRRAAEAAGIPPDRIHQVPNFCEIGPAAERAGRDHVLYVGRLVPEKGVDLLIRACAEARLPLRIVGEGRSREQLEALASAMRCDVTFTGFKEGPDIRREMGMAAVLAVPSQWHEVWPFVVLEAWDAGLPVVGSAVGGLSEQLDGGRGFLCPAGDVAAWAATLRRLVRDDRNRGAEAARAARVYARSELTRERWVERMRSVYAAAGASL